MNLNILPFQVYGRDMFPMLPYATELYLPFLKMPLLAYQESETTEQRIAWLFRAIADVNNILACHEEQMKALKKQVKDIEKELVTIYEKIEIERRERIEEDARLDARIDKEEAERKAEDARLDARIDKEEAERKAEDARLDARIDKEEAERKAEDARLDARIDKEEAERKAEDARLNTRITDEENARKAADTALGNRITAEENARKAADTALGNRITAEENARKECCEEVRTSITQIDKRVTDNTNAITKEIQDRKNADKAINTRIDNLPSLFINTEMFYPKACAGGTEQTNYPITINDSRVYGEIVTTVNVPRLRVSKEFYNNQQERKAYRIKYSKPLSYIVDLAQLPQQSYIWANKIASFYNVQQGYYDLGNIREILYIDPYDIYPRFSDVATWDVILQHNESYITAYETPDYVEISFPTMYATILMIGAVDGGSAKGFYADYLTEEAIVTVEAFYLYNN